MKRTKFAKCNYWTIESVKQLVKEDKYYLLDYEKTGDLFYLEEYVDEGDNMSITFEYRLDTGFGFTISIIGADESEEYCENIDFICLNDLFSNCEAEDILLSIKDDNMLRGIMEFVLSIGRTRNEKLNFEIRQGLKRRLAEVVEEYDTQQLLDIIEIAKKGRK